MLSDSVETAGASRMLARSFVALSILIRYFVRGDDSILDSQPNEQAFLKMQPVCRLQKNDTARRIDDFIGDFQAAPGGQTVKHFAVGGSMFHHGSVDLVRGEYQGFGQNRGCQSAVEHVVPTWLRFEIW